MNPRITRVGMIAALAVFAAAYLVTWQIFDQSIVDATLTAGFFTAAGLALLFAAKVKSSPIIVSTLALSGVASYALIWGANIFNEFTPWSTLNAIATIEPWTIAALFAIAETLLAVGGMWFLIKRVNLNPFLVIAGISTLFTVDHFARYGGSPGVFPFVWGAFAGMLLVAYHWEFVEGPLFAHLVYNLQVSM